MIEGVKEVGIHVLIWSIKPVTGGGAASGWVCPARVYYIRIAIQRGKESTLTIRNKPPRDRCCDADAAAADGGSRLS